MTNSSNNMENQSSTSISDNGCEIKKSYPRLEYKNKMIMAPMVKIGTTPARLVALDYGADIVYTEEIIDWRLLRSSRIENPVLNTIDYIDRSDDTLVLRISPIERGHLVIQIGTSDAERAIRVAKMVCKDVDGLDVNMGCPKSFSMKGGMGAALLSQPEKIKDILSGLVNAVGKDIPITCKIRRLSSIEKTLELVKVIQETGVSALAVHGRTKDQRPNHDNNLEYIQAVAKYATIPVIANGGSSNNRESVANTYNGIKKFWKDSGASSVMIARACEWNPSVFRNNGEKDDIFDVVHKYLKYAIEYDCPFTIVKYNVQNLLGSHQESSLGKQFLSSSTMDDLCKVFNMDKEYEERKEFIRAESNRLGFDELLGSSMSLSPKVARRDTSIKTSIPHTRTLKEIFENGQQGNIDDASLAKESLSILNLHEKSICEMDSNSHISMYEMYFPFIRGHYSANASDMPKTKLYTWIKKNIPEDIQPVYRTWNRDKMFRSVLYIKSRGLKISKQNTSSQCIKVNEKSEGTFFSSESWEKNKRFSEQAAAVVALHCLLEKEFSNDTDKKELPSDIKRAESMSCSNPSLNLCKQEIHSEETPAKKLKFIP